MIWLGAGVLSLILLLFALNAVAQASRQQIVRSFIALSLVLLGIAGLLLAITGKLALAFPLLGSAGVGLLKLRALAHLFSARASWDATAAPSGRTSQVRSLWLLMVMDHDSGHMEGEILMGRFEGRLLSQLTSEELLDLHQDIAGHDEDSLRLLEAWLDREYGTDWRREAHHTDKPQDPPSPATGMNVEEARAILGVDENADADAIHKAHRSLMKKLHPDQGGNTYFAAKLNQAKDVLLNERPS
ncbi:molecular chaperone DnaJ [Iodidimonas muriae]|uniref:Molecular chaperone DnaJ n=1 Tax=Iodidimonas muriae TaxID=261467 RepID=A0ABQ2L7Z8_9PROT|nr:DnaJ domain-containing protein [Iodidimonas muriae]GER06381.1 molecular chaperone DnaJ [Kordiimonadales bacterium JCM 17843]GGO04549.1 molecular chaperone DnaJ [Iodidimonas muriae]